MIKFDRTDHDVLAVCICGWRYHAAANTITASMVTADSAAMDHIQRAHAVPELERRRAMDAGQLRERRRQARDTPGE